jgi:nucleoside-diphosphate-sugar epimerase
MASLTDPPTVLVLGATGFIGQALVKRLRQGGIAVRALVRSNSAKAQGLADAGAELATGDLTDPVSVAAALDGIRHVYHLARGSGSRWNDYLQFDVEPTRHLGEQCAARGIRLYYMSSIAIYDAGSAVEVITEATPPSRQSMRLNIYARAKVESERLLAQMHRDHSLDVVVFRPGIVIGEGGSPFHPGVAAWSSSTTCRPWGGGRYRLPFVLVDDCADALVRALHIAGIAGNSFNLVGDADLSGSEYLDALERHTGIGIQRKPLPTWWLFARSLAKWSFQTLTAVPDRALPSYRYLDGLTRRATYSASLAKQRLGWAPVADAATLIDRGIARSIAVPPV